jgi:hypothetical protein
MLHDQVFLTFFGISRKMDFCDCHLGAIAATMKWGGRGEGGTRERHCKAAGGGGGEYKGLGCTVLYSVHTNSTCTRGGGAAIAEVEMSIVHPGAVRRLGFEIQKYRTTAKFREKNTKLTSPLPRRS